MNGRKWNRLSEHERLERLELLGESIAPEASILAGRKFGELPPSTKAAIRQLD